MPLESNTISQHHQRQEQVFTKGALPSIICVRTRHLIRKTSPPPSPAIKCKLSMRTPLDFITQYNACCIMAADSSVPHHAWCGQRRNKCTRTTQSTACMQRQHRPMHTAPCPAASSDTKASYASQTPESCCHCCCGITGAVLAGDAERRRHRRLQFQLHGIQ